VATFPDLALGVDVGSTNVKAALVTTEGEEVAGWAAATPDDAGELIGLVRRLVSDAVGAAASRPVAIGIAGMAESGVPLDADDVPITRILRWDQGGSDEDVEAIAAVAPPAGVRLSRKSTIVLLRALGRRDPEALRRMRRWAGATELGAFALTGELVTEPALAARTNAYDDRRLEVAGLRREHLPPVRDDGAAGRWNGIPVFVVGHDHTVGAWGAGARDPGGTADSVGTSEALVAIAERVDRAAAAAAGMSVTRTANGRHEQLLAGSASGGAMIQWWRRHDPDGERLDALLAALSPIERTSDVLVLPYPSGRQSPAPDPVPRVVVGDGSSEDRVLGLLQALVFQARWMREEQQRILGSELAPPIAFGAPLQRNPAWAALAATAAPGLRLVRAAHPVACSAGLLAASRVGAAVGALAAEPVEPAPVDLEPGYARFRHAVNEGAAA